MVADDRTQAQRDADDVLETAIRDVLVAYDFIDSDWAVGDWVGLVEVTNFAEGGRTRYCVLLPGASMPWHRINGLCVQLEHELADQERDDRE